MRHPLQALAAWWLRAEPHVMGRNAVAVVVALLQAPALAQILTQITASQVVEDAGPTALVYVWSGSIVLAGLLMTASYRVTDPEAERVLEIAALLLVAVVCSVYVAAVLEQTGVVGALYVLATLLALIINSVGRGVLLVRQVMAARRLKREYLEARA